MLIAGTDLETTGLLEPEHRIIEAHVGLYEWDGTTGRKVDEKTWRIDPKRSIDAKAKAVHKITEADLIGKPTWDVVGPEVAAELAKAKVVVAHNGLGFDFLFLIQEWERIRCAIPDFIPYDTMLEGRWATEMGTVPNLGALCWACGVPYDASSAHAADYDVDRMMDCYFFGLKRGTFKIPTA